MLLMIGFLFLVMYPIREGGDEAIQVVVPMLLTMGLPPFVAGLLFLLSQGRRCAARYKAMTSEGMIHSRCDSLMKAQPPSIVMPDLIGHPGVHIGVQEWHHEERGRLDPRLRGGDGELRMWRLSPQSGPPRRRW